MDFSSYFSGGLLSDGVVSFGMAYDENQRSIFFVGGQKGGNISLNMDVWKYDISKFSWSIVDTKGIPLYQSLYDFASLQLKSSALLLHGGLSWNLTLNLEFTKFDYIGMQWSVLSKSGDILPGLRAHVMVEAPYRNNRFYIHGGYGAYDFLQSDIYRFELTADGVVNLKRIPSSLLTLAYHAAVPLSTGFADETTDAIFISGGQSPVQVEGTYGILFIFENAATNFQILGRGDSIQNHKLWHDSQNSSLWQTGGDDGTSAKSEVVLFEYSISAGKVWKRRKAGSLQNARTKHGFQVINNEGKQNLLIVGGVSALSGSANKFVKMGEILSINQFLTSIESNTDFGQSMDGTLVAVIVVVVVAVFLILMLVAVLFYLRVYMRDVSVADLVENAEEKSQKVTSIPLSIPKQSEIISDEIHGNTKSTSQLQKNRTNQFTDVPSAIQPTNASKAETLLDSRKVFSLPAFLQLPNLDEIVIEKKLGEGALGKVWKAELKNSDLVFRNGRNPKAALKIIQILPEYDAELIQEIVTCFRQEITIMHTLAPHLNIVPLIAYFESPENDLVYVMPQYECDLHSLLHKKDKKSDKFKYKLTLEDRIVLITGIVDALNTMHIHGVSHNDLKPQNILISLVSNTIEAALTGVDGSAPTNRIISPFERATMAFKNAKYTPVISDFGLSVIEADALKSTHGRMSPNATSQTDFKIKENVAPIHGRKISTVRGFSVRYAAPEVLFSTPQGSVTKNLGKFKGDMWSVGVIMWEMSERKTPYEKFSDDAHKRLLAQQKAGLHMTSNDIDKKWFKSCFVYDHHNRISSGELLDDITAYTCKTTK